MTQAAGAADAPPPHDRREALLDAAARLFNEHGVRGATLAGIAAAVGLVTNSVTHYFRKKEDLAAACFMRSIGAIDAIAAGAMRHASVASRLGAFFADYARLLADLDERRHGQLIVFNDVRALRGAPADEVFSAYTNLFRRMRALLDGDGTGPLGRADLNARAHALLSAVNGVRAWIGRYETDEYPRMTARVADVLLHGLAAPGAGWPGPGDGSASGGDGSAGAGGEGREPRAADRRHADERANGTHAALLRAATALVNEQGYRGASVNRIAARLALTKGAFYHHHETKEHLITQCFERTFAVEREALRRAEAGGGDGWRRACEVARALARFQFSDEGPLLRASAISALPDPATRERVRRTMGRLAERMANVVVDGMIDGSIRPLDAAVAARCVVAAVNGAAEVDRWVPGVTAGNVDELYVRPALCGVLCAARSR